MLVPTYLVHDGPWTEEQYLDRPEELYYCELLDGELLLNPGPTLRHQRILNRLLVAFHAVTPDALEVTANFTVRMRAGTLFVPDLAVLTTWIDGDERVVDGASVAMVVEVASPSTVAVDRAIKVRLYGEAGIPIYVRVEQAGPRALVGRLVGDRYVWSDPDPILRLDYPFPVEIDLASLVVPRGGGV